jgi:uncharacterized membrane protein
VQLIFSALFLAVFWLVMWMGVALFELVHISFLQKLMWHSWFYIPASALAFAYAIDMTDVRGAIIRSIRTLKLTLLSWLLPVMAFFAVFFIASLPFKGAEKLWSTHHSTQILLGAAAWLILLINATYQDGDAERRPGPVLRYSARFGAAALLPLTGLAAYALWVRVGLDGWTANMVMVAASLMLAVCYSIGYLVAALSFGSWMRLIEKTNILSAYLTVILLLALYTPLADPARLSVGDQIARLKNGKVAAEKFDYGYLSRSGEKYGEAALNDLKLNATEGQKKIIDREISNPWQHAGKMIALQPDKEFNVYPEGKTLPATFKDKQWDRASLPQKSVYYPLCLFDKTQECDAFLIGDSDPPLVLLALTQNYNMNRLFVYKDGDWTDAGSLIPTLFNCYALRKQLRKGEYTLGPSRGQELTVNSIHIPIVDQTCVEEKN